MSDEPPGPKAAAAAENQEKSVYIADAYHASQLDEYNKIRRMVKFIQKKDDLNENVRGILGSMLEKPPSPEGADFIYTEVSDMANSLPAVDSALVPNFFTRASIVFRLIRRTLDMYLINPITEDTVIGIEVPDADREDPRILEHI